MQRALLPNALMPACMPWVFGLRPYFEPEERLGWAVTIIQILTDRYSSLKKSSKTVEAEIGLGIRPSWYWYVGRTAAMFGHSVFIWPELQKVDCPEHAYGVSSFDSGGLWFDHIITDPKLTTADEKRHMLLQHSHRIAEWWNRFSLYLNENYDAPVQYLEGAPPRIGSPPILTVAPNTAQAWTWEARVELPLVPRLGGPGRLHINEEDLDYLLNILEIADGFDIEERKSVADWLLDTGKTVAVSFTLSPFTSASTEIRDLYE